MNYLETDIKQCPFKERDLTEDVCYGGNGQNRCPYFVKYNWMGEHSPNLWCSHPQEKQLDLF